MNAGFIGLLLFAIVMAATPGPNNVMVTASAARFGLRRTVPHIGGVGVGFAIMLLLTGLGLGSVFVAVPLLRRALALACMVWMLWLAWVIARSVAPGEAGGEVGESAAARPFTFLQAALFQWVNPKAWMVAVTVVATRATGGPVWVSAVVIALVFLFVTLPVVGTWAAAGHALGRYLTGSWFRVFNVAMAILLVVSLLPLIPELLP
jgi:threonine/homoserine/homoserine lactone efflux protein